MTKHNFRFGEVVRLEFPFSEGSGSKQRPAVIISSEPYHQHKPDIMVAAITSRLTPVTEIGEFLIEDWQAAGLDMPSRCKSVIASASTARIAISLGRFTPEDAKALKNMLRLSLGL